MWISMSLIGSRCQSTIMALARPAAGNLHIEDGVVAGLGEKNPGNLLGIHFNGHRLVAGAIQHGRNLARDTHAARGILVELALTGLGYDYFRHLSLVSRVGHGPLREPLPLLRPVVRDQWSVVRKTCIRSNVDRLFN